jgi:hypothetical protein
VEAASIDVGRDDDRVGAGEEARLASATGAEVEDAFAGVGIDGPGHALAALVHRPHGAAGRSGELAQRERALRDPHRRRTAW